MMHAFVETFAAGHDRAVVVGTDHPTLPLSWIGEAFRQLDAPMTAAIGPSEDGGYTFLGLNDVASVLFDMDYSHARVFEDTVERIGEAGWRPSFCPPTTTWMTPARWRAFRPKRKRVPMWDREPHAF